MMPSTTSKSGSIFSFTTLPRTRIKTPTPSKDEEEPTQQDSGTDRRPIASSRSRSYTNVHAPLSTEPAPIAPPRQRRTRAHTQGSLPERSMSGGHHIQLRDFTHPTEPSYTKYELKRSDINRGKLPASSNSWDTATCDIIQSSQNPRPANHQHPDILLTSNYTSSSPEKPSPYRSTKSQGNMSLNHGSSNTRASDQTSSNNTRFVFYKPGLTGSIQAGSMMKPAYNYSSCGTAKENSSKHTGSVGEKVSFDNPAFTMLDNNDQALRQQDRPPIPAKNTLPSKLKIKPNALPSKPIYSTAGSAYSLKPCESPVPKSPLSAKFKKSFSFKEEPIEKPKQMAPTAAVPPQILPPILSARKLETCLKQYSSANRAHSPALFDTSATTDSTTAQSLDNMMKYYGMKPLDPPPVSDGRLHGKTGSPYSSSSSLNGSVGGTGETVEVIMRRKKRLKIRSPSITSDDGESVKRVSLEINLLDPPDTTTNTDATTNATQQQQADNSSTGNLETAQKSFGASQVSLSQSIENLSLDDLTTTETARYLRKQFTKLKSRANSLRVKDNELKQRFVQLQHRRGKVCGGGSGGGVTKTRGRMSPTPSGFAV